MKSILISNLNNLGDVICSTAALDLVRRNFPEARIGFLIRPDSEDVMHNHPLVDRLHVFRYKSGSGLGAIWRMSREIRRERYGVYISLDRKHRSALTAALAGIPLRVTPNRLHLKTKPRWWMPWLCNRVLDYPRDSFHSLVAMFEAPVKDALRIEGRGKTSLPPLSGDHRERAAALLAGGRGKAIVGFSVKANARMKDWPAERFAAVMDRLAESHDPFLYVCGAPADAGYIDCLIALCRRAKPVNLAGQTSLMTTVALAAASDCFITLDTGAVHLAGNSGIDNLICVFTSTEPEGVLESARQAKVMWSGEKCCPCSSCPHEYGQAPCQTGVAVDAVYVEAVKCLESRAP